jgi:hypothetical protein
LPHLSCEPPTFRTLPSPPSSTRHIPPPSTDATELMRSSVDIFTDN